MEQLIYAGVIGAFIGLALRYLLPGRNSYGLFLLPAVGGAATCVAWAAAVWLKFTLDGGWIWVLALGAALIASLVVGLLVPRVRKNIDAHRLHVLSGGHA